MRMFRARHAAAGEGPVYCCQEDGMIGLGCGARSYTRELHYSSEYAVGARGVREILSDYIARPDAAFDSADYGFRLDEDEQRRRYVIQSLLQVEGLSRTHYHERFGTNVMEDLPELAQLEPSGMAARAGERLRLTEAGLEQSDVIGPWLYSRNVQELSEAYEL